MIQCAGLLTFKMLSNKIKFEKKKKELCTRKRRVNLWKWFLLKYMYSGNSVGLVSKINKFTGHSCFTVFCNSRISFRGNKARRSVICDDGGGAFHYARPTGQGQVGMTTRGKWNYIFLSNRANQEKWILPWFIPFPSSLHKWNLLKTSRAMNRVLLERRISVGPVRPAKVDDNLQGRSRIFRSERTQTDRFIWFLNEISGTLGLIESIPRLSGI